MADEQTKSATQTAEISGTVQIKPSSGNAGGDNSADAKLEEAPPPQNSNRRSIVVVVVLLLVLGGVFFCTGARPLPRTPTTPRWMATSTR